MKVEFKYIIGWNTARGYTEMGQRIAVFGVELDGKVRAYYMVDLDRGLDYHVEPLNWDPAPFPEDVRRHVMRSYDYDACKTYRHLLLPEGDLQAFNDYCSAQAHAERWARGLQYTRWVP